MNCETVALFPATVRDQEKHMVTVDGEMERWRDGEKFVNESV